MTKLIVGDAPEEFAFPVEIPTPHGPREVEFTAKHLLSTEWSKLREEQVQAVQDHFEALRKAARDAAEAEYAAAQKAKAKGKATKGGAVEESAEAKELAVLALIKPVKESAVEELKARFAAGVMVKIFSGWDLGAPFGLKALESMCDRYRTAADVIFVEYNKALDGARLGNSDK